MDPLRIMLISDIHHPDYFRMPRLEKGEFDLVLTLGDIEPGTIDYILSQARESEVFGVYGNHDPKKIVGLDTLDRRVISRKGLRISGVSGIKRLPGSYQPYHHTYTENQMRRKLAKIGRVDILVAHAAPYSLTQKEGPVHQGFRAIDDYIEKYSPLYFMFGHLGRRMETFIGNTHVRCIAEKGFLTISLNN